MAVREVAREGGKRPENVALELAEGYQPEVVICDLGLPGMDGYEVARAIRANPTLRETFLLALSGYARPEDLKRARKAGFHRHVAKPTSLEKLEQLLSEARCEAPIEHAPLAPPN